MLKYYCKPESQCIQSEAKRFYFGHVFPKCLGQQLENVLIYLYNIKKWSKCYQNWSSD